MSKLPMRRSCYCCHNALSYT